jgi:hypothetical protein
LGRADDGGRPLALRRRGGFSGRQPFPR